ncbi:hypothetical protein [Paenibacillus lautus]|uniref:hypothetical protein n=1 Tax=Paenibacillus lautus TaxID=1401 RepID=UPI001C7D2E06|nr:hypothetical protein [Paenibacillus lautus]MBX4149497.1 hypothetical protein [Paenibacillus lautus]
MSIYVLFTKVNDDFGQITAMNPKPYPEQLGDGWYMSLNDVIPRPENIPNMDAVPYIDLKSKEIYYQYFETPPPPQPLDEQIDELKLAVAELTMMIAAPQA